MINLGNYAKFWRKLLNNRGLISSGIMQGNRGSSITKLTKAGSEIFSKQRDRLSTCRLCFVEKINCNASLFIRLMQARKWVFSRFLSHGKNFVYMCVISHYMFMIDVLNCELFSAEK